MLPVAVIRLTRTCFTSDNSQGLILRLLYSNAAFVTVVIRFYDTVLSCRCVNAHCRVICTRAYGTCCIEITIYVPIWSSLSGPLIPVLPLRLIVILWLIDGVGSIVPTAWGQETQLSAALDVECMWSSGSYDALKNEPVVVPPMSI